MLHTQLQYKNLNRSLCICAVGLLIRGMFSSEIQLKWLVLIVLFVSVNILSANKDSIHEFATCSVIILKQYKKKHILI